MTTERRLDPDHLGDHLDRLYRAAWALCGSRETAEDLVQDTFARVIARPRLLRSDDDLGYLLRVLRNLFLDQRRRAARQPDPQPLESHVEELRARESLQPDVAAEHRLVYEVVAALPEEFRDVVVAVDMLGLSYGQAARALRLSEGTVTSRVFRGRGEAARRLGESGATPVSAVSTESSPRSARSRATASLRG
jgi:RNA polymerase sigma-70 factor, ECF subfamily